MDPVEPWIDADAVRRMAAQLLEQARPMAEEDRPDAGFGPAFEGFVSEVRDGAAVMEPATRMEEPATRMEEPAARMEEVVERKEEAAAEEPMEEARMMSKGEPVEPEVVEREVPAGAVEVVPQEAPARPFLQGSLPPPKEEVAVAPAITAESAREGKESTRQGRLLTRFQAFRNWLLKQSGAHGAFILDRDGNPVLDDPKFSKLHFLARSLAQAYRPVSGQAGNVHVKIGSDAYLVVVPASTVFGTLVLGAVMQKPLSAAAVEVVAKTLAEAARPVTS